MLVSIIIPTFNSVSFLEETLDSVLAQTYTHWECVLVDDGSTDTTEDLITAYKQRDSRFSFFKRPDDCPKGPSSCRNIGIENAKGSAVIFLDSDDVLAPFCLAQRTRFKQAHPEADLWLFKMNTFVSGEKEQHLFNTLPQQEVSETAYYLSSFYQGNTPFAVTCPFWDIETLKEIKGFDELLPLLEDPDLHLRFFKTKGKSITAVDLPADCFYRIPSLTTTITASKLKKTIHCHLLFIEKHLENNRSWSYHHFKKVCTTYVFPHIKKAHFAKVNSFGKKHGFLTRKQRMYSTLLYFYNFTTLQKQPFSGYYYIRKQIFKA